jgi:hypothetical protein
MGQTALTVVGFVVGNWIAPGSGGAIGAAIGGAVGGAIFAPDIEGPKLTNTTPRSVEYGFPLKRIYGTRRIVDPFPAWTSVLHEIETEQDAKGGPTQSTFTYTTDHIYILGESGPIGLSRVWVNKRLVYTALASSSAASRAASLATDAWASITFLDGNAAQLPWPLYEAAVGSGNAIAHRWRCAVAIDGLAHGFSEAPPLVEFEVFDSAEGDAGALISFNFNQDPPIDTTGGFPVTASGTPRSNVGGEGLFGIDADGNPAIGTADYYLATVPTALAAASIDLRCRVRIGADARTSSPTALLGVFNNPSSIDVVQLAYIGGSGPSERGFALVVGNSAIQYMVPAAEFAVGSNINLRGYYDDDAGIGYLYWNGALVASGALVQGQNLNAGWTARVGLVGSLQDPADVYIENASVQVGSGGFTPAPALIADIVSAEFQRAGLTPEQFDLGALDGLTIDGFDTIGSPREAVESLMTHSYFGWTCGPVLKAVLRGGASARTLAYRQLGAGVDGADPECFNPEYANDQEVTPRIALTVYNSAADHANLTVFSDREVSESSEYRRLTLPVAATPARAQGIVDTMVADARVASVTAEISVTDEQAELECTDVITVTDEDGALFRKRIEQDVYSRGVHKFKLALDDASVLQIAGITADAYTPSIVVAAPGETQMVLLDIAPLRDSEATTPGHMVAASGTGRWRGASIQRSPDGVTFSEVASVTQSSVVGTTLTALSADPPLHRIDRYGTLQVSVSGMLTSSTASAMQLDRTINVLAVETTSGYWEVIRFRDAALVSSTGGVNVYDLSVLQRGRRGSEPLVGLHAVGLRVVLLTTALRSVATEAPDIGIERSWRGVTVGRSSADVEVVLFADTGVRLKPWAVTRVRVARRSGSNVATWRRRSRLLPRYGGSGGSSVPLGEATESYDVELRDASDNLVASDTVSEPEWSISSLAEVSSLAQPVWGLRLIGGELVGIRDDAAGTYTTNKSIVRLNASTGALIASSFILGREVYQFVNDGDDLFAVTADFTLGTPVTWQNGKIQKFDRTALGAATATYNAVEPGDFQGIAHDGTDVWVCESLTGQLRRLDNNLSSLGTYAINAGIGAMVHVAGSLWICDSANDELIEWDIATTSELQRISVVSYPFDVLIIGARAFVLGIDGLGVYDTGTGAVIVEHDTPPYQVLAQRQMVEFDGSVAVGLYDGRRLVVLHDAVTGEETARSATPSALHFLAGSNGSTLYLTLEPFSGGVSTGVQTDGFEFAASDLAGYSLTVWQRSAVVGRGYPTTLSL